MNGRNVSLDLMEFVEQNILPRYNSFDKAHRLSHVNHVIKQSLELALKCGADINMAYAIAAYHDLGLEGPRAVHHIQSGKILMADRRLQRWFSAEQLRIMKEAVEDHRASASHAPRSIYGKIVAEADRDLEPMHIFRRTVQYGLTHYPAYDREEHYRRFLEHLLEKYAEGGYLRLWIPDPQKEQRLAELRALIRDREQLRATFDEIFNQETER